MNKLLIAALASIAFTSAMAQEATHEYPTAIDAGQSRAAVQAELARAKLDGSCFAGGEVGAVQGPAQGSMLTRVEVKAALAQARADGSCWGGGEASAMSGAGKADAARTGALPRTVAMN